MSNSNFSVKGCSIYARKRDKLYVREFIALTIGMRGMFGLCTFGSSYSLDGRGFVSFSVDLAPSTKHH